MDCTFADYTLAVEPPTKQYSLTEESKLETDLGEMSRYSTIKPLCSVKEVVLDNKGRTIEGGLRFTSTAFFQLCSHTCNGLHKFLVELAGTDRLPEEARSDFSFSEACELYNQLVRRRFTTRLHGLQLVRNTRDGLIEGVMGPQFRWLPNHDFYHKIQAALSTADKPLRFLYAVLNGRWLLLRYYSAKSLCVLEGPSGERDRMLPGYHFSNFDCGNVTVRAAAMILRECGRTASLNLPTKFNRVAHRSDKFNRRLGVLLNDTHNGLRAADYYQQRFQLLMEQKLAIAGSPDSRDRRKEELVSKLAMRIIKMGVARRVIASTTAQGSWDGKGLTAEQLIVSAEPDRTAYDLYNAMGREAIKLAIDERESLEYLAYQLLTGKLTV
jgi:hypothetical protein